MLWPRRIFSALPCNPLSPFVLSSYVLSSTTSSLSTYPLKHWWDILFHLLLHLLSDWQDSLLKPRDQFFFICLFGLVCIHPPSKQGQFTLQRNTVLLTTSHFKPFIWLLNYPQHWTLICFADGKQILPNSLCCLGYPQPTLKPFWRSSDHFHFTSSPRLSQAPWISQAGGNCCPGAFWAGVTWTNLLTELRLSESAWAWNVRVCSPSAGSNWQDAVSPNQNFLKAYVSVKGASQTPHQMWCSKGPGETVLFHQARWKLCTVWKLHQSC